MNRRVITPLLIAVLSIMAIVPEAPSLLAHATTGPAVVAVSPTVVAGDVGQTVNAGVTVGNVAGLVGYDVVLQYDPTVLSFQSASFGGIFASPFTVVSGCSDATATCEIAQICVACFQDVLGTGSVMSINFKVVSASIVPLTITKADLAVTPCTASCSSPPNGVVTMNGSFEVPPTLTFVLPNATVAPGHRVSRISSGAAPVTLQAFITYDSANVRAGFGGVVFDVIDPTGGDTTLQSNVAFFFPGDSATVTASYDFGNAGFALGTYHIIVTMLRCPDPSSCVAGQTLNGLFFKLKS